ncbi:hypothetical protein BOVA604_985 [Bacteroides ovatus]|nr:hypothetical protein BOVA604_985 [Bacteroides ovatus]
MVVFETLSFNQYSNDTITFTLWSFYSPNFKKLLTLLF